MSLICSKWKLIVLRPQMQSQENQVHCCQFFLSMKMDHKTSKFMYGLQRFTAIHSWFSFCLFCPLSTTELNYNIRFCVVNKHEILHQDLASNEGSISVMILIIILGQPRFPYSFLFFKFKESYVHDDSSVCSQDYSYFILSTFTLSRNSVLSCSFQVFCQSQFIKCILLRQLSGQDSAVTSCLSSCSFYPFYLWGGEILWLEKAFYLFTKQAVESLLAELLINRMRTPNKFSAAHLCLLFPYHKCCSENTTGTLHTEVIE